MKAYRVESLAFVFQAGAERQVRRLLNKRGRRLEAGAGQRREQEKHEGAGGSTRGRKTLGPGNCVAIEENVLVHICFGLKADASKSSCLSQNSL